MSIQKKSNNKKLLEALDHVDIKYVAELADSLRLPKESAAARTGKRMLRASLKYAALIAACALLIGAAIPVAGNLIGNITSGSAASGNSAENESNSSSAVIENETPETEAPKTVPELMVSYGWSPKTVTNEEVDEIIAAYLKNDTAADKYDYTYSVRCYAKYERKNESSVYAVMIDSDRWSYAREERVEKVYYGTEKNSYISFIFPSEQPMFVYCGGSFYSLNEATEQSLLTFRQLALIRWSEREGGSFSSFVYPVALSHEELCEIVYSNPEQGKGSFAFRCYGNYDGAYVIFADKDMKSYQPKETIELVGGYAFVYPNENKLVVCANGTFLSLAEAYEKDVLSAEALAEVYKLYTKEREIKTVFLEKYADQLTGVPYEDKGIIVNFQGIFGEVYVAAIGSNCCNITKSPSETVNGLTFVWEQQYDLHVYKSGEFYTLSEAFEKSILTAEQLEEVYNNYNERFKAMWRPAAVE